MMRLELSTVISVFCLCALVSCSKPESDDPVVKPEEPETVSWTKWEQGFLDIHHICTGAGDCTYMILPDGTRMMIDAGNKLEDEEEGSAKVGQLPNSSKRTGEWIARYVNHFNTEAGFSDPEKVDYFLVTHFHDDHIGSMNVQSRGILSQDGSFYRTGISDVGVLLNIGKFVDRAYPDYNYPAGTTKFKEMDFLNYKQFLDNYLKAGGKAERFNVGSDSQFPLKHASYPSFSIRNIYAGGVVWTGSGTDSKKLITDDDPDKDYENSLSTVIRVSYGKFDYHSGGDIEGEKDGGWRGAEQLVAPLVGEVDVAKANHHGHNSSTRETFVRAARPQAWVVTSRGTYPKATPLASMLSTSYYKGNRDVYVTGMYSPHRNSVENGELLKPEGHVIVRVYQGGSKFRVFVFDRSTEDFKQIYVSSEYQSRD